MDPRETWRRKLADLHVYKRGGAGVTDGSRGTTSRSRRPISAGTATKGRTQCPTASSCTASTTLRWIAAPLDLHLSTASSCRST